MRIQSLRKMVKLLTVTGVLTVMISACGQKGPLRMPEKEPQETHVSSINHEVTH